MKFISFFGGKSLVLKDIKRIAQYVIRNKGVTCLVDVFGGSGKVSLFLTPLFRVIVYNDIDLYLYKTFKVIQDEKLRKELIEKLELSMKHRKMFEEFVRDYENDVPLSDTEIAFRTIYIFRNCWSGYYKSFGISPIRSNPKIENTVKLVKKCASYISKWLIENMDYKDIIKRYNSDKVFLYLDPPYVGSGKKYKYNWTVEDCKYLKELLDNFKGYWLMNISKKSFDIVTEYFGEPAKVIRYKLNLKNCSSKYYELGFWMNFDTDSNTDKQLKLNSFTDNKV